MSRLLIMLPSRERGGAEGYALDIGRAALQAGFEVHVACPEAEGTEGLVRDFVTDGMRYHPTLMTEARLGFARHALNLVETLRLLVRVRPRVVLLVQPWTTDNLGSMVACACLRQPAIAVFQLAPEPVQLAGWRRRLQAWGRRRGQRWVAVSRHNRDVLCRTFGCRPTEISVIPNGVRAPPPTPRDERARIGREVRAELGFPADARIVITVGRLERQKGYDLLLEAVADVAHRHPDTRFVWVGDGGLRGRIEEGLANSNVADRVSLLGHRTDVPRLMTASDLFVLPTRFEGFPFAVLEAMAAGLPVIASDASSLPEAITDGESGLLFRSGDAPELAERLGWALEHPSDMESMASTGRDRASRFTVERMRESTLSLLEEVCSPVA